jgi:hypothetical protein
MSTATRRDIIHKESMDMSTKLIGAAMPDSDLCRIDDVSREVSKSGERLWESS